MPQKERREYTRVNKQERREFARVIIKLQTNISSGHDVQIGGWTKDLSIKGVYVLCSDKLPLGSRCQCRLALGPLLKGSPAIEVEGKVVRCDAKGVAVQFTDVAVDCFRKLREYFWESPA